MAVKDAITKAKQTLADNFIIEPPVDLDLLVRNSGLEVRVVKFPKVYERVSGFLNIEDGKPVVYINEDEPSNRQKFTLAHELGHWLMHEGEIRSNPKKAIVYRIALGSANSDPMEKEANAFAAELLVPMSMFMPVKNKPVKDLTEMFQVSADVIGYRKVACDYVEKAKKAIQ